jgi:hypothetical protein
MGHGIWTRWGRGSCEGWSLDIGDTIRCQVVRGLDHFDRPTTWRAASNDGEFGEFATRDLAMAEVEFRIRQRMVRVMEDWATFQTQSKRPAP